MAHQVGAPVAAALLPTAFLGSLQAILAVLAIAAALFLLVLAGVDALKAQPPRGSGRKWYFRAAVALHHLLQPLVRAWTRLRHTRPAQRGLAPPNLCRRRSARSGGASGCCPWMVPEERSPAPLSSGFAAAACPWSCPPAGGRITTASGVPPAWRWASS